MTGDARMRLDFCIVDGCHKNLGSRAVNHFEHLRKAHGADMSASSAADALDDLDDAREAVKRFETGLWWAIFGLLVCAALIVGGGVVISVLPFMEPAGVAAIVVGAVGGLGALIFGGIWLVAEFDGRNGQNYAARRQAQKAYDRALRRAGEKLTKEGPQ